MQLQVCDNPTGKHFSCQVFLISYSFNLYIASPLLHWDTNTGPLQNEWGSKRKDKAAWLRARWGQWDLNFFFEKRLCWLNGSLDSSLYFTFIYSFTMGKTEVFSIAVSQVLKLPQAAWTPLPSHPVSRLTAVLYELKHSYKNVLWKRLGKWSGCTFPCHSLWSRYYSC